MSASLEGDLSQLIVNDRKKQSLKSEGNWILFELVGGLNLLGMSKWGSTEYFFNFTSASFQFFIDPMKLLPLARFLPKPPGQKGMLSSMTHMAFN